MFRNLTQTASSLTATSILTFSTAFATLLAFAPSPAFPFEPASEAETAIYNERLIPAPVETAFGRGIVVFNDNLRVEIALPAAASADVDAATETVRKFFADKFAATVEVDASTVETAGQTADAAFPTKPNASRIEALADPEIAPNASAAEIAARRETSAGSLKILAADLAGVRDSLKTLEQLSEPFGDSEKTTRSFVPELKIADEPALAFRGLHLCWFPETSGTRIEQAIRIAAFYKFNVVVIEFWGTFPFENRPELYWDEFHTTKDEVKRLVKLGEELGVELVPQMNLFGHAPAARVSVGKHVVLDRYPEYAPLFEPDGWTWRVSNPETRRILSECVVELLETFDNPRYFHIGCDEAYSAGTGFETRRPAEGGEYVDLLADWLRHFRDLLAERNCRALMWHDMLLESSTEYAGYVANGGPKTRGLVDRLPKDVVICDWQYDAPKKDETWPTSAYFRERGFDVVGCPWRDVAGIRSLATDAAQKGGFGVLCTTWHRFYDADMRQILVYGAQAAWGTRYRGGSGALLQAFNRHLRQAGQNTLNKKYRDYGVDVWQVERETVGPAG